MITTAQIVSAVLFASGLGVGAGTTVIVLREAPAPVSDACVAIERRMSEAERDVVEMNEATRRHHREVAAGLK